MKKSCERISYENTSIKLRYAAITVNKSYKFYTNELYLVGVFHV